MNQTDALKAKRRKYRRLAEQYYYGITATLFIILAIALMIPITLYAHAASVSDTEFKTEQTETVTEPTSVEVVTLPIVTVLPIEAETVPVFVAEEQITAMASNLVECYTLASNSFTIPVGDVDVDIDQLMTIYYANSEYGKLNRNDDALINTCVDFLYTQLGVNDEIVAGIIGNICNEGHFGEEQGTYKIATDVNQYISNLKSDVNKGYGIAQWTYPNRQDALAEQVGEVIDYFMAEYGIEYNDCVYGEYYPTVIVVSELLHLYNELDAYQIFENFEEEYTLEDATGRVALSYEAYRYSKNHWKYGQDGNCYLIGSSTCSGAERLAFAELVYEIINNN